MNNELVMQFSVNNQVLTRTDSKRIVEDSANYLYAHFTFTEDWNGTTKYAIVDNKKLGIRYKVPLDENDTCKIPSALIKYDGFGILVVGEDEREFVVITTSMLFIQVLRTNYQAAEEPDIKFITSDTLDIEKDGDKVVIEIPNIYVTDASLQNDSLEVYGRDSLLLKSVPLPYGRVNNITLQIDNNTFTLELKGFDKEGNLLFTRTADFAIEGMLVTGIAYDSATKEVVVSYKNGTQARASIAPILSGYATEQWVRDNFYDKSQVDVSLATKQNKITNENKLSSDLVEDANSQLHKFVSATEKQQITDNKNAIIAEAQARTEGDDYLVANTGGKIDLILSQTDFKLYAVLKNIAGATIATSSVIDLPLESVVVSGRYDAATKMVILTLQNGSTIEFSVADLISGLQEEITPQNKLDADLVSDTTSANKFVSQQEKTQITTNKNDIASLQSNKADLTNTRQEITADKIYVNEIRGVNGSSDIKTTYNIQYRIYETKVKGTQGFADNFGIICQETYSSLYREYYISGGTTKKEGFEVNRQETKMTKGDNTLKIDYTTNKLTYNSYEVIDTNNATTELFLNNTERASIIAEIEEVFA